MMSRRLFSCQSAVLREIRKIRAQFCTVSREKMIAAEYGVSKPHGCSEAERCLEYHTTSRARD